MKSRLLIFLFIFTSILHGQTSKELLRDGLFAEESEGDLKTATEKYEALLKAFEAERKVAAVALFRLAAVKRKQGDDKAALALYEEFGKKFGSIEPQATMVRENYLAISGKEFPSGVEGFSEEDKELARIKKLEVTSPDLFPDLNGFGEYTGKGWTKVVGYLLKKGADPDYRNAIVSAASSGNLVMMKLFLGAPKKPSQTRVNEALVTSIHQRHWQLAEMLASAGANIKTMNPEILSSPTSFAFNKDEIQTVVKYGGSLDYKMRIPLHAASLGPANINQNPRILPNTEVSQYSYTKALLDAGADIEAATELEGVRALHLAAWKSDEKKMQILIDAGADLNAMTNKPPKGKNWTIAQQYYVSFAMAPIDCVPLEKISFLLDTGAKPTRNVLDKAVAAGEVELVKRLFEAGVDTKEESPRGWSLLDTALNTGNNDLVDLVLENGADLKDAKWEILTKKMKLRYARDFLYPEFVKEKDFIVTFPECGQREGVARRIKVGSELIDDLLDLKFPQRAGDPNEAYDQSNKVDLGRLTWTLFRDGGAEVIDMTQLPLPDFKSGGILEVTGFSENAFKWQEQGWSELRSHPSQPIPLALLRSQRGAFQLTLEGETWDMMLCPDLLTYDVSSFDVPQTDLAGFLRLISYGGIDYSNGPRWEIVLQREGFPEFKFEERDSSLSNFSIRKGDRIFLKEREGWLSVEKRGRPESRFIRAKIEGKPGGWIWELVDKPVKRRPSLLALLADINIGFEESELISDGVLKPSLSQFYCRRILPRMDLSRIVVRSGTKLTVINLEDKRSKRRRGEKPFDLELKGGDELLLRAKDIREPGFLDGAHQYFQDALNLTVMYQQGQEEPKLRTLRYHQPRWLSSVRGLLPISDPESVPSLRGPYLSWGMEPTPGRSRLGYSIRVDGELHEIKMVNSYWPKSGDFIVERTKSKRNRFVPKPSE